MDSQLRDRFRRLQSVSAPFLVGPLRIRGVLPILTTVGTYYVSTTLATTHAIAIPTHKAGDLLALFVTMRNDNTDAELSSIDTAGWEQFGGAGNTYRSASNRIGIGGGWKIGNAAETTVSITCAGGTTNDVVKAVVLRMTCGSGFAAAPINDLSALDGGGAAGTSQTMPTITPSGLRELALSAVAVATSTVVGAATGESGGNWTKESQDNSGALATLCIQQSDQSSGAELSGGTAAWSGSVHHAVLGLSVVPATL